MRAEFTCIKLRFASPVHLGEAGIGVEKTSRVAHSDTLWSALCNALVRLYGDMAYFEGFVSDPPIPPFLMSSAFPWCGDAYYFAKPLSPPNVEDGLDLSLHKALKKSRLISKDIFEAWINAQVLSRDDLELIKSGTRKLNYSVSDNVAARVALGHTAFTSSLYYVGETHFKADSGLFFLVDFKESFCRDILLSCLRLLGEEGLGGRRSKGYGQFEFEESVLSISVPDSPDRYVTLSLLLPDALVLNALTEPDSFYGIAERKGWSLYPTMEQTRWKPVFTLQEGSVLPGRCHPVGKIVNVAPDEWNDKPIYRNGLAFAVPMLNGG